MKLRSLIFPFFALASLAPAAATVGDSTAQQPTVCAVPDFRPQVRCREWLFGIGHDNVLDTYLTPYEYSGPDVNVSYRSERLARWGKGHVSTVRSLYVNAASVKKEWGSGEAVDGEINLRLAFLYNWKPAGNLRLALGPMAEVGLGGTYHWRSSNNPAQARLYADIGASALAEYAFRIRKRRLAARLLLDVPLVGAKFTPHYGQSYYEIFSLGHTDKIVSFTHPFNAPSARLTATLQFPLWGATITAGYLGEARQSHIKGLKYHAWTNAFVIGFVRRIKFLK